MITLPKIKENFKKNFSLSKLTWFQTGGKAEFFYVPSHIEDLKYFLKKVKKIPIHIKRISYFKGFTMLEPLSISNS